MSEWTMGNAVDRNNVARDIADECGWHIDEYDDEDRVSLLDAADTVDDLRKQLEKARLACAFAANFFRDYPDLTMAAEFFDALPKDWRVTLETTLPSESETE